MFQLDQDTAAPVKDAKAAADFAKAAIKVLPGLLQQPINLVLRQQQQARPKKGAASSSASPTNDYGSVMSAFKVKALADLQEFFPGKQKRPWSQQFGRLGSLQRSSEL